MVAGERRRVWLTDCWWGSLRPTLCLVFLLSAYLEHDRPYQILQLVLLQYYCSSGVNFRRISDKMLVFYRVAAQNSVSLLSFNARFSNTKGESYFFYDGACVWVRRDGWLYSKYR